MKTVIRMDCRVVRLRGALLGLVAGGLLSVLSTGAVAQEAAPRVSGEDASSQQLAPRGWIDVNPAPVTPEAAEAALNARGSVRVDKPVLAADVASTDRVVAAARNFGASDSPASIAELARALKNSPDLMYEYVRNNIEFYPVWGVQKGPVGAILGQKGTAFDQALLLRDLARQAGFSADLLRGTIRLTGAQAAAWLGVSSATLCSVADRLSNGYVPISNLFGSNTPAPCGALTQIDVGHVWVRITIGGVAYVFDPAYKPRAVRSGINLATVTGYSQSSFITSAQTGATLDAHYVQNMNRTAARNSLNTYATNLINHIRSTNPNGALHDVLGGPAEIVPYTGPNLRQTSLPYQTGTAPVVMTEANAVAANNIDTYKVTLRLQFRGIDRTFHSDAIYGRRLTFSFNASNVPELRLDGVLQASGTASTPGTSHDVTMTITHRAYTTTAINQTFSQAIQAGPANVYAVSNGWGPMGGGTLAHYQRKLDEARASGAADGSEAVMGATVALLSAQWLAQVHASRDLGDRVGQGLTISHHDLGIAGYNGATYVDLPGSAVSVVPSDRSASRRSAMFYSSTQYGSVLESTAVQQVASVGAASTVSLIDRAVANGNRVYDVSSSNYSTVVQPLLASWGCSPQSAILSSGVSQGLRFVMPANCAIAEGSWQGAGYFQINTAGTVIGAIINGGLQGANNPPATPAPSAVFNGALDGAPSSFMMSNTDISVGVGDFPYSLALTRTYSSGSSQREGAFGRGWSHNLGGSARVVDAGMQGLGEDAALDAAVNVVAHMVTLDLLADAAKPLNKMVLSSLVAKWASEHLVDNAVSVRKGTASELFVKLPDGSYNPPPGNSARLTQSAGAFSYETKERTTLAFNTSGELISYTLRNGLQARFTYSGGNLTGVSNSLGRAVALTYSGNRIVSATSAGRTVSYAYAGNNLSSFTNTLGQATTYAYTGNLLTQVFYATAPTVAALTNTYDSLGRISQQTDGNGKVYRLYFAGSRNEREAPGAISSVTYLNSMGRVVRSIDPEGRATTNTYDAAGRITRTTFLEGNSIEYTYADATCAASERRCTHNVLTVVERPKPGSTLAALTTTNTYETTFNKLASTTNPRGQVTSYTYNATHGEVASVTRPAALTGGVQPQTTFAYTAYTATGFPTFHLLTSETSRVASATDLTTTTRSYNAANAYVPATVVQDSGTGGLALTTTFTYDVVGNLTVVNGPRADVTDTVTTAYDSERRPTQITDALARQTRIAYDAKGRAIRTARQIGTQWMVACVRFSATDKPTRQWGPSQVTTETCPAETDTAVPITDYAYDDLDRVSRVTTALTAAQGGSRLTDTTYFRDGQVASVTRGAGTTAATTVRYTYTTNGLLATLRDGRDYLTTFEYDGFDRRSRMRHAAPGTVGTSSTTDFEQYTYDANGNRTSVRLRNGNTVTSTFDNLDRETARTYATTADNVSFTYDLLDRMLSANRTDHAISYVWDKAGRLTSTTAGGRTLAFQYDAAGNRTRITWPDAFFVTTSYDALNRPTSIRENGTVNLVTSYAYDDLSRRATVTLGNSTTSTFTYGAQGATSQMVHNLAGTAHDVTFAFTRNQKLDITNRTANNAAYRWAPSAASTRSYTANGLNQYTAVAGVALAYDTRGNLAGDGTWTWTYDDRNQLTAASRTGTSVALTYDATGRMRQEVLNGTTTTQFLYDGSDLVAEYNGAGTLLRKHVHGPGIDEPLVTYEGTGTTNKTWLYADHQGSIVAAANSTGTATATHSYGPFGVPNVTAGPRFKYTGQAFMPNMGLYYYKARFYSPTLGRFLQTDPIGFADDTNMYAYVGNNPFNLTDPTGLAAYDGGFGGTYQQASTVVNSAASNWLPNNYSAVNSAATNWLPANYMGTGVLLAQGGGGGLQDLGRKTAAACLALAVLCLPPDNGLAGVGRSIGGSIQRENQKTEKVEKSDPRSGRRNRGDGKPDDDENNNNAFWNGVGAAAGALGTGALWLLDKVVPKHAY